MALNFKLGWRLSEEGVTEQVARDQGGCRACSPGPAPVMFPQSPALPLFRTAPPETPLICAVSGTRFCVSAYTQQRGSGDLLPSPTSSSPALIRGTCPGAFCAPALPTVTPDRESPGTGHSFTFAP